MTSNGTNATKMKKRSTKNRPKSSVNIPDTGYNERQEESVTATSIKDFKELKLTDNYMFSAVMKDSELCRPLLEMILDVKIERIVYSEKEKTIATVNGIIKMAYITDIKYVIDLIFGFYSR